MLPICMLPLSYSQRYGSVLNSHYGPPVYQITRVVESTASSIVNVWFMCTQCLGKHARCPGRQERKIIGKTRTPKFKVESRKEV